MTKSRYVKPTELCRQHHIRDHVGALTWTNSKKKSRAEMCKISVKWSALRWFEKSAHGKSLNNKFATPSINGSEAKRHKSLFIFIYIYVIDSMVIKVSFLDSTRYMHADGRALRFTTSTSSINLISFSRSKREPATDTIQRSNAAIAVIKKGRHTLIVVT